MQLEMTLIKVRVEGSLPLVMRYASGRDFENQCVIVAESCRIMSCWQVSLLVGHSFNFFCKISDVILLYFPFYVIF